MSALTLTLPDGGALALRAGQLAQCAWSSANQTAISAALLAAGQVTLALPAQGGLLSTLSVADNLTLAASYHGMPWAELDAALALLLPALALDATAWRTLLATPTEQLSADDRRRVLLLRAALTPAATWLIDSDFFADAHPDLAARGQALLAKALPGRLAVWLSRPARPAQPGAEWKEPPP